MARTVERAREHVFDQDLPDPEPPPWRERLLPKTVLGMTALILAAAVGAAFSGAVFYAYYEYRLNQNEKRIAAYTAGFDKRFTTATKTIAAEREQAKADIRKELKPIQELQAQGEVLKDLVKKTSPAVWFVNTRDEAGNPSVGSAFVVASSDSQSLLLTSFSVVRAATKQPAPDLTVTKGGENLKVQLWTWQEDKDLALLVASKGNLAKLNVAPKDPPTEVGDRVFVLSGLGADGGAVTQGLVADVSAAGLQHDAAVGSAFRGAPLLNSKGEVLAVASTAYQPLGFDPGMVTFAVPVNAACERVLKCPGGSFQAGAKS